MRIQYVGMTSCNATAKYINFSVWSDADHFVESIVSAKNLGRFLYYSESLAIGILGNDSITVNMSLIFLSPLSFIASDSIFLFNS